MTRATILAICILLAGVWLHPLVTGAGEPEPTAPATAAPAAGPLPAQISLASEPLPAVEPVTQPATAPASQPALRIVSGVQNFWHLAKSAEGVWWFVSPDGVPTWLNNVTTVQPYQIARDPDGPMFLSSDYDGGTTQNGNLAAWAERTIVRVKAAGFAGLGAWCHPIFHNYDIPITRDLNVMKWVSGHHYIRFYSPDWAPAAERAIKLQTEKLRDNRNLIGYFIDNELDWGDGGVGPSIYFNNLLPSDPNRAKVVEVIKSIWTELDQFNADWKTDLKDWKELDTWSTLPRPEGDAYSRLFSAWLSNLARDYFELTCGLIRKYDPNHLILGVRFKGYAPREVVRASRGLTDVQSINYYVGDGRLDYEMFKMISDESEQPVMIGEYSFHALDGRSGNRNTFGFLAQVLDQEARADGYYLFTSRLSRVPFVVGADWFQWMDEPPSGRSHDGEDVNFGVVDIDDRAYEQLIASIQKARPQLEPLHAESWRDSQTDVWREAFVSRPQFRVPYLSKSIRLNGELSDWPAASRVDGVRHSYTIGLERSAIPIPNVYLGWDEKGIYLGMEVFDRDIQGAPASGWWWTRDHVEFWFSTRPVKPDQNAYDLYSHQFFFVPIDFPGNDGVMGVVGQWARPGGFVKTNQVPHPAIKDAVRILPDRYVVEVFLPAEALHGFDPKNNPTMAFNIHVRNFQHAIDYFWSSPKEVMTQLRPGTWGTITLDPPVDPNAQALVTP